MGWLPQSVFDNKRKEAIALTKEQREALTWEEARRFVVADTLDMAKWGGMERRKDHTPWKAVCILRRIGDDE